MGIEGRPKQTPDEILRSLDAGEIKPGRVFRDVVIPLSIGSIYARVDETNQTITYSHNGVTVEASFTEAGPTTIVLTDSVTERPVDDQAGIEQHRQILTNWHKNRQH
jgi:hypothetical protein